MAAPKKESKPTKTDKSSAKNTKKNAGLIDIAVEENNATLISGAVTDDMLAMLENQIFNAPETGSTIYPIPVTRSAVTLDEITSLLSDINLIKNIDEKLPNSRQNLKGVSISENILENTSKGALDNFSRAVLEAVLGLFLAGNTIMSASMIFRSLTGKTAGETVNEAQRNMVDDVMQKLMWTPVQVAYDVDNAPVDSAMSQGPLIPAQRDVVRLGGKDCPVYRITTIPVLLQYCVHLQKRGVTNTLTVTPYDMLEIEGFSYTQQRISILNCLQRCIGAYLYPIGKDYIKPEPITILYESLYEIAATNYNEKRVLSPTEKSRIRDSVDKILDAWKGKKYIKSYEKLSEKGRTFYGIKVVFPDREPPHLTLDSTYLL